jgi:type IV pilus assembly protein PilQ
VKNYYYPLLISGAAALFLAVPSQAAAEEEQKLKQDFTKLTAKIAEGNKSNFIDLKQLPFCPPNPPNLGGAGGEDLNFPRIGGIRGQNLQSCASFESEKLKESKKVKTGLFETKSTQLNEFCPPNPPSLGGVKEADLKSPRIGGFRGQLRNSCEKNNSKNLKQSEKLPFDSELKLDKLDTSFTSKLQQLIAQTPAPMVPQPQITIQENGANNQNPQNQYPQSQNPIPSPSSAPTGQQPQINIIENGNNPNGMNPGVYPTAQDTNILQTNTPTAPVMPRAVAPPVGDMAISNIDASAQTIDLGTNAIVPRLVLREAPAREVLTVLARYAGVNVVFLDGNGQQQQGQGQEQNAPAQAGGPLLSLDLENESVQDVFNYVLMASGLQANRMGRTVFVGADLPQTARNVISRTIRLNQADASDASAYLALQGAQVNVYIEQTQRPVIEPRTGFTTQEIVPPRIVPLALEQGTENVPNASGARPLDGLLGSVDPRLNSINLTGEPRQVEIATTLLTQLDARRRQVAVNVKVVDVNLSNTETFNSSFSFGVDDTYFVQDQGAATLRFGTSSPPTTDQFNSPTGRVSNPPVIPNPFSGSDTFVDLGNTVGIPGTEPGTIRINNVTGQLEVLQNPGTGQFFQRTPAVSQNPFQTGIVDFTRATDNIITVTQDPETGAITQTLSRGTPGDATSAIASLFQYPKRFLAQLNSQIVSGNAKILTDPTLVVQEGQNAEVKLTETVVESVQSQVDPESGVRTTTPVLAEAGLTLNVNIQGIDDNGFVSLSVSPVVAAPGNQVEFDSGNGAQNVLTLLNRRELRSGLIRLRDGQTLILSGIIQESDRTVVSKVPLLGDIPLLGALFRSTDNIKERAEVVILLTPQIIDDDPRSQYGYNYNPGSAASELLQKQGFEVQNPNPQQQQQQQNQRQEVEQ